ncbi:MAG: DUF929 family protein [Actinobacteria bacterium]|nr:DUF929 family protein [Actinomycetota bacterium]
MVAVLVVLGASLIAAVAGGRGSSSGTSGSASQPAPASLVQQVSTVPAGVFDQIGAGTAQKLPQSVSAPALTSAGKPRIVYLGAEYCPYCATERWPMVVALSRFGTFTGLRVTHSASNDVYPNTPTFSFHGATYQSPYLAFDAVELETNQLVNGTYKKLDTATPEEQQLMRTYDVPPYTSTAGAIPFIDFGGRFLVLGATYDPQLLQNRTAAAIGSALSDPSNPATQGIVGTANTLTAAICTLTNNQPGAVCATPAITSLEARLH